MVAACGLAQGAIRAGSALGIIPQGHPRFARQVPSCRIVGVGLRGVVPIIPPVALAEVSRLRAS